MKRKLKRIFLTISAHPKLYTDRGIHNFPEAMMHFPPVSDFPLFPKSVQTPWKIFPISPFPTKTFRCSSAKISIFALSVHSSPISGILLFSPNIFKSPPFRILHNLFDLRFPLVLPCMMHLCITQCKYWTPLYIQVTDLCLWLQV